MHLDQIMKKNVASCKRSNTLAEAAATMWDRRIGCLPVVDDEGKAIAMLTDRDICMASYLTGQAPWALSVESAMSKELVTATGDLSAEQAAALMRKHHIRRLPIVDASRNLVGLASLSDLAVVAAKAKSGEAGVVARTLSGISEYPIEACIANDSVGAVH